MKAFILHGIPMKMSHSRATGGYDIFPWKCHGSAMSVAMALLRHCRCHAMAFPGVSPGNPMARPWQYHGSPVALPWGILMVVPNGSPMACHEDPRKPLVVPMRCIKAKGTLIAVLWLCRESPWQCHRRHWQILKAHGKPMASPRQGHGRTMARL